MLKDGPVDLLIPKLGETLGTRKATPADTGKRSRRVVAPTVAPDTDLLGHNGSTPGKTGKDCGHPEMGSEIEKTPVKPGLNGDGQYWIRTGDLCRVKAAL